MNEILIIARMYLYDNINYITRRAFIKLTPALTGAALLQTGVAIIDLMLIGIFCGSDGLAIATVFIGLWYLWEALLAWLGNGAATLFSHAKGEKNLARAQAIFSQALTMAILLAGLLTAGLMLANRSYLNELSLPPELLATANVFGLWLIPTMALSLLNHLLLTFISSDSNPRGEFNLTLIQNGLNFGLDLLFMGYLDTGVVGSLYAFIISTIITMGLALYHFSPRRTRLKIALAVPRYAELKAMLGYSYYAISTNCGTGILCGLFSGWILNTFGVKALAVYGVINSARLICEAIFNGIINASSLLLAGYLGERNFAAVKNIRQLSLITGLSIGGVLWGLFVIFPQVFSGLFALNENAETVISATGLRIFAASLLLTFVNMYYHVFLQVSGRGGLVLCLAWISALIIPLGVGGFFLQWGTLTGFWYHYLLSESIIFALNIAVAMGYRYREKITSWWLLATAATDSSWLTYGILMRDVREELGDYQEMLEIFFRKHHVPEKIIYQLALAVEELATYATTAPRRYLDLQVLLQPQTQVQVTLRYESTQGIIPDNLIRATPKAANPAAPNADDELLGLRLLYKLADTFYYDHIAGFNYLCVEFKLT